MKYFLNFSHVFPLPISSSVSCNHCWIYLFWKIGYKPRRRFVMGSRGFSRLPRSWLHIQFGQRAPLLVGWGLVLIWYVCRFPLNTLVWFLHIHRIYGLAFLVLSYFCRRYIFSCIFLVHALSTAQISIDFITLSVLL